MKSANRALPARYLLLGVAVIAAIVFGVYGLWLLNRTETRLAKARVEQNDDSKFTISRRLQDGKECIVKWRAAGEAPHAGEFLKALEVSLDGKPVEIPPEALSGLPVWDAAGSVAIAEAGQDVLVLLAAGATDRWTCFLRIRDYRIVDREFVPAGSVEPIIERYSAPFGMNRGTISPEEAIKARAQEKAP